MTTDNENHIEKEENSRNTEQTPKSNEEKLIDGYNMMMERMKQLFETAEAHARPKIMQAIEYAKKTAIELNELTKDEAQKIGDYIKRDISDAAEYLAESENDLSQWFQFDIKLIENWLWEAFSSVADKTRLELIAFSEKMEEYSKYHTGEVTGPGTLICTNCGKKVKFEKTGRIPPCGGCKGTEFERSIRPTKM
ncbi:MAG: hypothetical protein D6B27_11355 [Gammaproteobacteria bacterium]|nr:MAG: hypothetical protein D6B27_11355 [Gammaproteobacteria bacterium]